MEKNNDTETIIDSTENNDEGTVVETVEEKTEEKPQETPEAKIARLERQNSQLRKKLSGEKKGYTLPFSPPWSSIFSVRYHPKNKIFGSEGDVGFEYKVVGAQDRIVPPENKTKGYQTLNLTLGRSWNIKQNKIKLRIQGQNLLNKRYFNHISYYRIIDVPEPGRNISIMAGYNF